MMHLDHRMIVFLREYKTFNNEADSRGEIENSLSLSLYIYI